MAIPVTNTSVNPARSTGVAVFVGGWAMAQLWLFWLAPIIGGVLGAWMYRLVGASREEPVREFSQPEPLSEPTAEEAPSVFRRRRFRTH